MLLPRFFNRLPVLAALLLLVVGLGSVSLSVAASTPKATAKAVVVAPVLVTSTQLVTNPATYLQKTVQLQGVLSGFSGLGLNYKPVFRSSESFVTLLLYRSDVPAGAHIPLTELKLFVGRKLAEQNKGLAPNDEVRLTGKVVSAALGDAWVDVQNITVLKKAPKLAHVDAR